MSDFMHMLAGGAKWTSGPTKTNDVSEEFHCSELRNPIPQAFRPDWNRFLCCLRPAYCIDGHKLVYKALRVTFRA